MTDAEMLEMLQAFEDLDEHGRAGPSDIADVLERLYEHGLGEFGAEKMAAALAVFSDERSLEEIQQIAQQWGSRSDLSWAATVSSLCLRGELLGIKFVAPMLAKGQKSEPIRTDEVLAFKQLATVLKKFGKPYLEDHVHPRGPKG